MNDSTSYEDLIQARTRLLLGDEDLAILRRSTVAFAGCGGVGGAAIVILARMGVGGFVLADPGSFDEPDVNRQWAAARSTLGRNKAVVYEQQVRDINPSARVRVHPEGVTNDSLAEVLVGADVVVDGLDFGLPLEHRMRFYAAVRERGRYCVSSPIVGFGTLTLVSAPDGMGMEPLIAAFVAETQATGQLPAGFGGVFFPDHVAAFGRGAPKGLIPSSMIATTLSGVMQAVEILLILLHHRHPDWRAPTTLPQVTVSEPLRPTYQVLHCAELFPSLRLGGG